jgi:hypothetical protein
MLSVRVISCAVLVWSRGSCAYEGWESVTNRISKQQRISFFLLLLAFVITPGATAQTVRLIPDRSGEPVRLVYGNKSARVNIEEASDLPGNPAHVYQVLLTTVKDRRVYLLVRVCSHSPISNPMGPCGGDRPCALLWITADQSLGNREIKSEIFASCSYNYNQIGRTKITGGKLTIVYEDTAHRKKIELSYDNANPDAGIVKKEL